MAYPDLKGGGGDYGGQLGEAGETEQFETQEAQVPQGQHANITFEGTATEDFSGSSRQPPTQGVSEGFRFGPARNPGPPPVPSNSAGNPGPAAQNTYGTSAGQSSR